MALTLHPPTNLAWTLEDGTPNANGRLKFFEPGTTNSKNVHFKDITTARGSEIDLNNHALPVGGPIYFVGRYDIGVFRQVDLDSDVAFEYIENFGETEFRNGVDGARGAQGIPGVVPDEPSEELVEEIKKGLSPGIEFIFAVTAEDEAPSLPDNDWDFDMPVAPWSDGAPDTSPLLPYLWQSIRRQIDGVWLHWSAPTKVSKYGIDGVDGDNAIDGEGFEAIFISTATTELPPEPDSNWGFDNPQDPWHDVHPGINQSLPYTWTSTRRKVLGVWQAWSPARIVSQFSSTGMRGVDGTDGTDGEDAFGVEFIYTTTTDSTAPSDPMRAWSFASPGAPWHRDPQDISETDRYHWISTRHTKGEAPRDGAAGDWTSPVILNRWVEDGRDGDDAVGTAGQKGEDGEDGVDGVGLEFIYAITNNDTIAEGSRPSNEWGYKSGGTAQALEWFAEIPGLTDDVRRLFSSHRAITGTPADAASIPAEWSLPALIGNIATNGTNGTDLSAPERVVLFDAVQGVYSTETTIIQLTANIPDREGTLLFSGWGGAFQARFDAKTTTTVGAGLASTHTTNSAFANSATTVATRLADITPDFLSLYLVTESSLSIRSQYRSFSPPNNGTNQEKLTITFIPD